MKPQVYLIDVNLICTIGSIQKKDVECTLFVKHVQEALVLMMEVNIYFH